MNADVYALLAAFALVMGATGRLVHRHTDHTARHRLLRPAPHKDRIRHLIARRPR